MQKTNSTLGAAIKKIAWGYVFLYFNITIGPIDILPSWAGYLLIFSAISVLALYEESSQLLRNVAALLAVWSAFDWALTILEANNHGSGVFYSLYSLAGTVASVIAIYFHFQLLTNLAGIAAQLGFEDRAAGFLRLRTINTVLQTILALCTSFYFLEQILWLAIVLLIVNLIVLVCIVVNLFGFRKQIDNAYIPGHGPTL